MSGTPPLVTTSPPPTTTTTSSVPTKPPDNGTTSTDTTKIGSTDAVTRKKQRAQNFCYAPRCRTGQKGAPRFSMFTAPKDPKVRKVWQYNLRRLDKPLTEFSCVCERHFDPRFIVRDYVHIINGAEVRIPRGKPKLAEGAVPTLLPDLPGYLSKKLPKQRPTKGRQQTILPPPAPSKKRKQPLQDSGDDKSCPDEQAEGSGREDVPRCTGNADTRTAANQKVNQAVWEPPLTIERLRKCNIELPSVWWCLLGTRDPNRVVFATTEVKKTAPEDSLEVTHPKLVSFSKSDDGPEIVAEAYFQGALCCKALVTSLDEAKAILRDANATHMCKGAMTPSEFEEISRGVTTQLLLKIGKNDEGTVFSLECTRNVDSEGSVCAPCRILRKNLQTRKSRVLRKLMKDCLDEGEPASPMQTTPKQPATPTTTHPTVIICSAAQVLTNGS
uniref:Thap domain protein n=1 Tax=Rhipicephalus appendiculatus TaxID=34631 RepID=A0A131YKM7_RHIAP